jgi:quercetin dioxygenase-like cupin family protein
MLSRVPQFDSWGWVVGKRIFCVLLLVVGLAPFVAAQDAGSMGVVTPSTSKFANMAALPSCMTLSVLHGDPSKGPSTILLKFKPGCSVPWHWHTANESLVLASGAGIAQMKDGKPMSMKAGDYLYLSAKGIHRFTAQSAVYLYDMPDGAFDIHYVDSAGSEIPPEKALAAQIKVKPAAAPVTTH